MKVETKEAIERDPLARTFALLERRWVWEIIRETAAGPKRHTELVRTLAAANEAIRVALALMVKHGLLDRTPYAEFPPRVDYSLTPKGEGLVRIVAMIEDWAERWEGYEAD